MESASLKLEIRGLFLKSIARMYSFCIILGQYWRQSPRLMPVRFS